MWISPAEWISLLSHCPAEFSSIEIYGRREDKSLESHELSDVSTQGLGKNKHWKESLHFHHAFISPVEFTLKGQKE